MRTDRKWYGHPGHLIVSDKCRFHLCTVIGPFLVSTVGEYWPDRSVREIHANVHDPEWLAANQHLLGDEFDDAYMEHFGFERIGAYLSTDSIDGNPIYETLVFHTRSKVCDDPACDCGLPSINPRELEGRRYATAGKATQGHYEFCEKYDAQWNRIDPRSDPLSPMRRNYERKSDAHPLHLGSLGIDE